MDTTIAHCCRRPLCAAAGPAVESQHKVTGVTFDFWRGENQERWLTRQRICCQSKKQNYLSGNMSGLNSAIIGNLITYWWKNSCYLPEKLEVCVLLPTSLHLQLLLGITTPDWIERLPDIFKMYTLPTNTHCTSCAVWDPCPDVTHTQVFFFFIYISDLFSDLHLHSKPSPQCKISGCEILDPSSNCLTPFFFVICSPHLSRVFMCL